MPLTRSSFPELLGDMEENVPLAPLTTFGVGGPARFFFRAESVDAVENAVRWARQSSVPLFILGGGSNLLVSDRGFPGLVLQIALRGVSFGSEGKASTVEAAAGEEWDPLVAACVARNLAGIECLSGIPGLVGATPIQNVGAYGQEVKETIERVDVLDRSDLSRRSLSNAECQFGYRSSLFKNVETERYIVLRVAYRLIPGGAPAVRYPDLQKELAETANPSLQQVRDVVIAVRRRKGMVIDPADPDTRSAGSFFMNPIVSPAEFSEFEGRARKLIGSEVSIPSFPASDGKVKVPAAWLIEHAGFHKSDRRGNAGISSKHTLALVNRGGASSEELRGLAAEIVERVRTTFGITLEREPNYVG